MEMSPSYSPLPISHFKATLPQNASTLELTSFLSDYFRVILPGWVVPNLVAITILMGGLVVAAMGVLFIKLRTKTFWFFRLQKTDSGNLIVVSPTSSFVIIEGFYALGLIVACWAMVARSSGSVASTNFGFSCLILGIPLLAGSWNGVWGLFLSCPMGIQGRGSGSIRASVLNFCFIAIPSVFCAVTVVFTCLQGFAQRSASHQWHSLKAELQRQEPQSMPTVKQLDEAAKVFQDGAYAWHRMSQGYTYFFVFAVLMTIGLIAVGFYLSWLLMFLRLIPFAGLTSLRKILQHHLRYNAEFIANDDTAWANSVYYFPKVQMPENAHSTPLRGRTRRLVLHSALKLVQSLSASIAISALLFAAITGYFAFALYPKAVQGPKEIGHIIGILIVFFGWVTVAASFPCWYLITSDLFEPALLGWQSRRAVGTNVVIKSPAFNDSVSDFKIQDLDRQRQDSGFDDRNEEGHRSTDGYRMKTRNLSLSSRKDGSVFSDGSQQERNSEVIAAIRVDRTFEDRSPAKQEMARQKRSTIIADDGEEDELDSRERGSWRKMESRTSR